MNAIPRSLSDWLQSSPLYGANAPYVEDLYARYRRDPTAVPAHWRKFFDSLPPEPVAAVAAPAVAPPPSPRPAAAPAALTAVSVEKQVGVLRLINYYRVRGHQVADLDPLGLARRDPVPDLDPATHGLGEEDLDTVFNTGSLYGPSEMRLADILELLRRVYTETVGAEYMHITDTAQKRWIQERLEGDRGRRELPAPERRRLLERLIAAEGLERYLHTRYVGQKRFSLEGGESLIPLLDELILRGGTHALREVVIGMAHRGRLNVLMNILGKSPEELFAEFEGRVPLGELEGSGDVKYHQGFSADARTPGGIVHLALAFNPSHLEIVGPVVEGSVRARQQRRRDLDGDQVMPILIHGDAAFAGQGVVMENFNMSQARGFTTGGTVHVVVNNQIGFTTSNPLDSRSTLYCTDVAKMVQAPIFHVNGDDPEAVIFVTRVALDFRMAFHKDVVVDLVCYRRHGHNEADEPAVTQPVMYRRIREHPTVCQLYGERLRADGVVGAGESDRILERYRQALEHNEVLSPYCAAGSATHAQVDWRPYFEGRWDQPVDTSLPLERVRALGEAMVRVPPGFELHPRVQRIVEDRRKMAAGALPVDWGFAENLAYASLVTAGHQVRLSGQDSGRGTFFHRHAVLYNQVDGTDYTPLQHLDPEQAHFIVIDSLLSEEAVLAFEYGYATAEPRGLTIWEAQFGDFANVAQVVIDQFISSGEAKWQRLCGLTLFLPHGFEGQGPEHSSARLERFLQLCAEYNMQVCVPTTPAQMFHLLRRQQLRPYRKPLVVMTPKSLLRHRLSVSSLEDLTGGRFRCVIPPAQADPAATRRVVLCAGKVYYDLEEERQRAGLDQVAIIRLEQLYPFPHEEFAAAFDPFAGVPEVVWCQEEPRNQGAWYQSQHHLFGHLHPGQKLHYAGRPASASPATGYFQLHLRQQRRLVAEALGLPVPRE